MPIVLTDARRDTQCVNADVHCEVLVDFNETSFEIYDATRADAPVELSSSGYDNLAYVHSGWLTEDQQFAFVHDELRGCRGTVEDGVPRANDVQGVHDMRDGGANSTIARRRNRAGKLGLPDRTALERTANFRKRSSAASRCPFQWVEVARALRTCLTWTLRIRCATLRPIGTTPGIVVLLAATGCSGGASPTPLAAPPPPSERTRIH